MIMRLLKVGAIGAVAVAVLAWPVAWALESTAIEVQYVEPGDEASLGAKRDLYALDPEGYSVAELYGTPFGKPTSVIFADEDKIVRPKEDESLTLLLVDRAKGEDTFQTDRLRSLTLLVSLGGAGTALGLFVLRWLIARRSRSRGKEGAAVAAA